MKIAVIGAGVVGVASAYELTVDGHEVTLFDRHNSVAAEASFAPTGLMSPGHIRPWTSPSLPAQLLRQLLDADPLLRVRPTLRPETLRWLWRSWRAGRARTFAANWTRLQHLAAFSRARLHELSAELKLEYERSDGHLVLVRSASEFARLEPRLQALSDTGIRFHTVDARACLALEPGLNPDTPLHAGIHLPDDEAANSRQFALLLRAAGERRGLRCRLHTPVQAIVGGAAPALLVGGSAQAPTREAFDAIAVCAGVGSLQLLRPLGVTLPLLGVHGYSITAPLVGDGVGGVLGPRSALTDERHQVAISRLGQRVRVGGGAEIGGSVQDHLAGPLRTLHKVLDDWFPGSARAAQTQAWKGTRAMLPDGPPLVGPSGVAGVWLNLGHGGSGWTLACGSARLLADSVAGRPAAIEIDGLGIERLHR